MMTDVSRARRQWRKINLALKSRRSWALGLTKKGELATEQPLTNLGTGGNRSRAKLQR